MRCVRCVWVRVLWVRVLWVRVLWVRVLWVRCVVRFYVYVCAQMTLKMWSQNCPVHGWRCDYVVWNSVPLERIR